jgi:hypothetical protein
MPHGADPFARLRDLQWEERATPYTPPREKPKPLRATLKYVGYFLGAWLAVSVAWTLLTYWAR